MEYRQADHININPVYKDKNFNKKDVYLIFWK
jgi:hypothetical protein